jgi:mannose-6-phosphate isomerase-like protein (cupin superfamily)
MIVPPFARLPLSFDVAPLVGEVATFADDSWVAHFNAGYHDGGWQGVALRASGGDPAKLYADPAQRDLICDTGFMARCPGIAAALTQLQCPLSAVRVLRLAPGSVIREHRDDDLRFEDGEARLHIPLITNPGVEFFVDGQRVIMEPGECWYLNLSLPHRVQNRGAQQRIHLVVDCNVNDWLRTQIAMSKPVIRIASAPSGQERFADFRRLVFAEPALQEQLRAVVDPSEFVAKAKALGAANGFVFSDEDVRAAMARGRHAWLVQWQI